MESEFYQLVYQFAFPLGEVEYFHCAYLVVLSCVVSSPLIPRSLLCIPSSSRPQRIR